ncbi:MAG: hypothetical protein ABEJ07_02525 [Candidatus Nanohaloarchaea archaeon]
MEDIIDALSLITTEEEDLQKELELEDVFKEAYYFANGPTEWEVVDSTEFMVADPGW